MRRLLIATLVAATLALGGTSAMAQTYTVYHDDENDAYVDGMSHPLRLAAYLVHPVGFALEWLVMRPFHFIISRPQLDNVFGYRDNEDVDIRF